MRKHLVQTAENIPEVNLHILHQGLPWTSIRRGSGVDQHGNFTCYDEYAPCFGPEWAANSHRGEFRWNNGTVSNLCMISLIVSSSKTWSGVLTAILSHSRIDSNHVLLILWPYLRPAPVTRTRLPDRVRFLLHHEHLFSFTYSHDLHQFVFYQDVSNLRHPLCDVTPFFSPLARLPLCTTL